MKSAIWGHDEAVSGWVAQNLGFDRGFGDSRALGVARDDVLIAGVVYHDWYPEHETIQVSAYAQDRHWLTPQIIREIFHYPFSFCQAVFAQTSPDNAPTRAVFRKLGASEMTVPRLMGRQQDGILICLTQEAWEKTRYCNGQT